MSSEEAPLLSNQHNLVYERFSPQKKRVLVVIVSWAGLVAFLTAGTFVPSIPQIARGLNTTEETISVAVSINILASAVGSLLGSKYAKFYGRRPAFLWCLPVMIIGSLGVGTAENVTQLMVWRFIQGMGASPGLSVGAAVIGDIYKLEERGTALGSYFGAGILGLSLAPVIGGIAAYYFSWRAIHYGLAAFTFGAFFCILSSFPETSHPGTMGIDMYKSSGKVHPKWRPVILNPFGPFTYLRSPNIVAVAVAGFLFVLTDFTLLIPFTSTIGRRYGIENEAIIGACLLPLGLGGAAGAPLSGWVSDKVVAKYRRKRGYWYPEDRLRASLFGFFLPVAVFAPAVITKYVPGTLGLVMNLLCFLINGIAIDVALTPCGAYIIDILPLNSAEVTAAVSALRSLLFSVSTAMLLPMITTYGYILTSSIVSFLAFLSFCLLYVTIVFGESMRGWVDVGFAIPNSN